MQSQAEVCHCPCFGQIEIDWLLSIGLAEKQELQQLAAAAFSSCLVLTNLHFAEHDLYAPDGRSADLALLNAAFVVVASAKPISRFLSLH